MPVQVVRLDGAIWLRRSKGPPSFGVLCGLHERGIAHWPLVHFAAGRTEGAHVLLPDTQQRADLAFNPAVDLAAGVRADENQVFHSVLPARVVRTLS